MGFFVIHLTIPLTVDCLRPDNVLQSTLNISKSKIYEVIKKHDLNGFIPGRKIVLIKENGKRRVGIIFSQ